MKASPLFLQPDLIPSYFSIPIPLSSATGAAEAGWSAKAVILLDTVTIVVYGLLTVSILFVWFGRGASVPIWIILFALSAGSGFYYEIVEPGGILYLVLLAACCYSVRRHDLNKYIRILSGLAVLGLTAGLFLHKVPFFNNPLVFDSFLLSEQSSAYTKYWNFDKAAAGLILLASFGDICRSRHDWKLLVHKSWSISAITIVLSLLLALSFGYIRLDITLAPSYFIWAWGNLFFTCIPEEMLFRGFLQNHLTALVEQRLVRIGVVVVLGILFGLAHSGGGAAMLAASVAGIGYGYAYYATGRIESAILTHFLLNSIHFLFFTYPHL